LPKLVLVAPSLLALASIALLGCGVTAESKINIGLGEESASELILKESESILNPMVPNQSLTYKEWILSNYPQFEQEKIDLQLRDSFQYGGWYAYPRTIIINIGDVEVGSALLKQRVEHELTHYFLRMKYNDLDYDNHHDRNGEYILQ